MTTYSQDQTPTPPGPGTYPPYPSPTTVNARAVRIVLECILVFIATNKLYCPLDKPFVVLGASNLLPRQSLSWNVLVSVSESFVRDCSFRLLVGTPDNTVTPAFNEQLVSHHSARCKMYFIICYNRALLPLMPNNLHLITREKIARCSALERTHCKWD